VTQNAGPWPQRTVESPALVTVAETHVMYILVFRARSAFIVHDQIRNSYLPVQVYIRLVCYKSSHCFNQSLGICTVSQRMETWSYQGVLGKQTMDLVNTCS